MRLPVEVAEHLPPPLLASRVTQLVHLHHQRAAFSEACLVLHAETPYLLVRREPGAEFDAFQLDTERPLDVTRLAESRAVAQTRGGDRYRLWVPSAQHDDLLAFVVAASETERPVATERPAERPAATESSASEASTTAQRGDGVPVSVAALRRFSAGEAPVAFLEFCELTREASALDREVFARFARSLLDLGDAVLAVPASQSAGRLDLVVEALALQESRGLDEAALVLGYAERAVTFLRQHLARHPETSEDRERLGARLLALGEFVAAEQALERAVELDESNWTARYLLGVALLGRGLESAARAVWGSLADAYVFGRGDDFVLTEMVVMTAWRRGDDARAAELLDAAASLEPADPFRFALGELREIDDLLVAGRRLPAALCVLYGCDHVVLQDELAATVGERLAAAEPLVAAALFQRTERGGARAQQLAPGVPLHDVEVLAMQRIKNDLDAQTGAEGRYRHEALVAFAGGELEEALAIARRACAEAPTLASWLLLAQLCEEQLLAERAAVPALPASDELLGALAEGLALAPDHPELSRMQSSFDPDPRRALAAAERLLAEDPLDEDAIRARVKALLALGSSEDLTSSVAYLAAVGAGDVPTLDAATSSTGSPRTQPSHSAKFWRYATLAALAVALLVLLLVSLAGRRCGG